MGNIALLALFFLTLLFQTPAWAAIALVQQISGSAETGPSVSATYSAAPTTGNLLVACVASPSNTPPVNPSGWQTVVEVTDSGLSDTVRIASRIAGAGEPSLVTFTGINTGAPAALGLFEFSGVSTVVPIDTTASSLLQTGVTSIPSGTTATTAQAGALATVCGYTVSSADIGTPLWDSGFTTQHDVTVSVCPTCFIEVVDGYKILGGQAPQSSALSWQSDATAMAVIAVFNPSGELDNEPPTNPTNLQAVTLSSDTNSIAWTASTDNIAVCTYPLERCQGDSCVNFAQIAAPSTTTFQDTNLAANTIYRYRVRARDCSLNTSGFSSIAQTTTHALQTLFFRFVDTQPDGPDQEAGFIVNRKTGTGGVWGSLSTPGPSAGSGATITVQDTSAPWPTSCYQSAAQNTGGQSSFLGGDPGICFTAQAETPALFVGPASMTFNATTGGGNPPSQVVTIQNLSAGQMSWTIADNVTWLSVNPTSGTNNGTATATVSIAGLTAGVYQGTITVTAPGATGSPATIPVTLNLVPASTPSQSRGGRIR